MKAKGEKKNDQQLVLDDSAYLGSPLESCSSELSGKQMSLEAHRFPE